MKSRRNVLKLGLFSIVAGKAVLTAAVARAAAKKAPGLDSKNPDARAKSLNYYTDASKLPADKMKPLKARAQGKEPKCSTCVLYSKDATEGYGKCTALFQQDLVADKGICTTWNPKPA